MFGVKEETPSLIQICEELAQTLLTPEQAAEAERQRVEHQEQLTLARQRKNAAEEVKTDFAAIFKEIPLDVNVWEPELLPRFSSSIGVFLINDIVVVRVMIFADPCEEDPDEEDSMSYDIVSVVGDSLRRTCVQDGYKCNSPFNTRNNITRLISQRQSDQSFIAKDILAFCAANKVGP